MATDKGPEILDCWKQIADFLRRGVRTAQRWERTEGLPVHRHQHMKRGSVYAVPSELAEWLKARRLGPRIQPKVSPNGVSMQSFDQLRMLTARQVALTSDLKRLLASNADIGAELKQRKLPVRLP